MTYEELVAKAKETYGTADASKITEHVAIQFNVTGDAEGAFYLEIADGKVNVEPYEYYDRDVIVTTDAETLIKMAEGKLGMEAAYLTGKIKADGNLTKGLLLKELVAKKPAKKAAAKKPAEKKTVAKKAVKEETKVEAAKKPAPKKTAVKKADETKAASKPAAKKAAPKKETK